MKTYIQKFAAILDAKRDLLLDLKENHPDVFSRLYYHHLKDRLTYSDFESALINTLSTFGITILIWEDLSVHVQHTTSSGLLITDDFDAYEDALQFAVAILKIK